LIWRECSVQVIHDGAPKSIKITVAMIERGVTELFFYALDDSHVSAECIAAVYSAME